jgi:hypothetical protein
VNGRHEKERLAKQARCDAERERLASARLLPANHARPTLRLRRPA